MAFAEKFTLDVATEVRSSGGTVKVISGLIHSKQAPSSRARIITIIHFKIIYIPIFQWYNNSYE